MRRAFPFLLAIAAWVFGIVALAHWEGHEGNTEYMSVPPAETARLLAAGYDNLAADAFYVNFVIYFGKHLRSDKAYHNVLPVLTLATRLDPHFFGAYTMGALALGDNGEVDQSEALWNQGVAANPLEWRYAYQAGINLFLFASTPPQYERAARLFHRASELKGPKEARYMEARCFDVGQRQDLAIHVWLGTYQKASSDEERKVAARWLERLHVPLPRRSL